MQTTPETIRGRCGNTNEIVAVLNSIRPGIHPQVTPSRPSSGQAKLIFQIGDAEREIDTIKAKSATVVAQVETLLATMVEARKDASRCSSQEARTYYRKVADDAANAADQVLKFRHQGGPFLPGRPVPPSKATIRRALDRHKRKTAAGVAVLEATVCVMRAVLRNDGSWEQELAREGDAERALAQLSRFQ